MPPLDWHKGYAASSPAFYEISRHPVIGDFVAALLGEDVMLWGAGVVTRRSGMVHSWHSDIESSGPSGKTVAVWIGLKHTTRDSSLHIVPYSHRFGVTVQEVRHQLGNVRDGISNEDILGWARERDKRAHLLTMDMTDGEALFFDGKLWHGSHNLLRRTRRALLLQYATPDTVIRIPDLNHLEWPFRELEVPRPPCLMLRGSDQSGVNRIVSAPVTGNAQSDPLLTSRLYPLRIPLPPDEEKGLKSYPIFHGSTAEMQALSCHASVLAHDHSPHPPHRHKEEELLLLLTGEVELSLSDEQGSREGHGRRLVAGQFVYYPAGFAHTLKTASQEPANYVMFKWHADSTVTDSPLPFGHFRVLDDGGDASAEDGFHPRLIFEGPTDYLRKLHCHASTLTPGAGYEPHVDAYDVAIVVLEGEVETLGERVGPHGVIFYRAGEAHGMHNPGKVAAKYLVFEFHGSQAALKAFPVARSLLLRVMSSRRLTNQLGRLKRFMRRV